MKTKSHNVTYTNTELWAERFERRRQSNTFFLGEPGTFTEEVNFELTLKDERTFPKYDGERRHFRDPRAQRDFVLSQGHIDCLTVLQTH